MRPVESLGRLLCGSVTFRATGGFPDLFLEGCAKRGVRLENVRRGNGTLNARTGERTFPAAEQAAREAGMTVEVLRRAGLPRLARRYRARIGLPVGLLLGTLLLLFLTGRIWQVTVTGQTFLGEEEILDAMGELGLVPGARIRKLDLKSVEEQAQQRLPRLSWIAVNRIGCRAEVEVREIIETPELTDEKDYANLVAALDGVIVSADVLEGAGQPLVGSAVVKGDLLVSGIIEMKNGFQRFVNAKALVKARTKTELSVSFPQRMEAERPVRRRDVYSLRFFGLTIPLGRRLSDGETEYAEKDIQYRKTVFPIGIQRESCAAYETGTFTLSEEDALLVCFSDFCEQAFERYRDAELLKRSCPLSVRGGTARVTARSECVEEIAQRQPFTVESALP